MATQSRMRSRTVIPGKNALKQWLSAKTQSFFGVRLLQAQLSQIQQQLQAATTADEGLRATADSLRTAADSLHRVLEAAGQVVDLAPQSALGLVLSPLEQTDKFLSTALSASQENLRALQDLDKRGLFVLGCARSGTTILTRSLNRSPDVLLLEEATLFLTHGETDYVPYFNAHHASMGNRCLKGTYLPPPLTPENGPMPTLLRLTNSYRLVGEKVALGPHYYPPNWQQAYLDFQGKFFFHSKYLHIMRTPMESIWSMHKMFPDRPVSRLFQIWLESIALSLDAYHVFPNSKVLFFDDLGQELLERLSPWLQVPIPGLPGTFGRKYMYSALSPDEIPEPLRPFADLCRECTALYHDLRSNFSKEEFAYCGATTEWAYFDQTLRHIQKLIDNLTGADEAACPAKLRIAA